MEERKITLVDDDQTLEFYVVEETKLNGANYLLVTDAEDDDEEGDCYILKDMSGADESDALYEFVEDEDELEGLMKIFAELLDDVKKAENKHLIHRYRQIIVLTVRKLARLDDGKKAGLVLGKEADRMQDRLLSA